ALSLPRSAISFQAMTSMKNASSFHSPVLSLTLWSTAMRIVSLVRPDCVAKISPSRVRRPDRMTMLILGGRTPTAMVYSWEEAAAAAAAAGADFFGFLALMRILRSWATTVMLRMMLSAME